MDLDVQRRERDTGVCRTQRLDDQVVDGDAARQQPGCVADRVRLQPGVEDTAFNLGGIGGERVLTTEVAVVPPVEYWCLGVKQGYLRLVRPVAFTAIKKAIFIYVRGLSDSFAIVPNDKKNKTYRWKDRAIFR